MMPKPSDEIRFLAEGKPMTETGSHYPMPPITKPAQGEPYLLTPGPLTTSENVKKAMLRDWGSRDGDFQHMTAEIRRRILAMVGDASNEYDCVPIQGSGTFAVEAMIGAFAPKDRKTLVLVNGAYGKRIAQILDCLGRPAIVLDKGDYIPPRAEEVSDLLKADSEITHVVVVHCETSSGILNPIKEISDVVYANGAKLLVDSMSAFGAIPLDVRDVRYDAMVSSANKCIEGVPGFGFVVARKTELEASKGASHSLSLDVHAQWVNMNKTGQWRFTPPTHVLAAFLEALLIHEAEGGVEGRGNRYRRNCDVLVNGMRKLGFETLLQDEWMAPVIVTFFNPVHPKFDFEVFYDLLNQRGFVIYPGKLTVVDSFRMGCIGWLDETVMKSVVDAVADVLAEMGVDNAAPSEEAMQERSKLAA